MNISDVGITLPLLKFLRELFGRRSSTTSQSGFFECVLALGGVDLILLVIEQSTTLSDPIARNQQLCQALFLLDEFFFQRRLRASQNALSLPNELPSLASSSSVSTVHSSKATPNATSMSSTSQQTVNTSERVGLSMDLLLQCALQELQPIALLPLTRLYSFSSSTVSSSLPPSSISSPIQWSFSSLSSPSSSTTSSSSSLSSPSSPKSSPRISPVVSSKSTGRVYRLSRSRMNNQLVNVDKLENDLTPLGDVLLSTPISATLYKALFALFTDVRGVKRESGEKLYIDESMSLARPSLLPVFATLLASNRSLAQDFLQDLYLLLASNPVNCDILLNSNCWIIALLFFATLDRTSLLFGFLALTHLSTHIHTLYISLSLSLYLSSCIDLFHSSMKEKRKSFVFFLYRTRRDSDE